MLKNNDRRPYLSVLCVTAATVALAACSSSSPKSTVPPASSTVATTSTSSPSLPPSSPPSSPTVITSTSPSVTGQFTGLPDGSKVAFQQPVSGVVRGLPPGTDAWIVVYPVLAPAFWPQPGPLQLDSAGGFRTSVYFGASATQNIGEQFITRLVIASPAASARFRAFLGPPASSQGLPALPPGVQTLATVTVTRR
jgi:hypothetical protein